MSTAANRSSSARTDDRHPAQYLALAIGAAYTLVGIAGFFVTGFDQFASPDGELLLGFEVNPLHNIVHLAIGVAGLVMWNRLGSARGYGWLLVALYGPALIFGLVVGQDDPANILAINSADNWLHAFSVLAGLAIALWPAKDHRAQGDRSIDLTASERSSAGRTR